MATEPQTPTTVAPPPLVAAPGPNGPHPGASGSPTELATYRRELARLIDAGEHGRYALIQGETLYGTWDTLRDALQAGYDRFGLGRPFATQKIDRRDLTRIPAPGGAAAQ